MQLLVQSVLLVLLVLSVLCVIRATPALIARSVTPDFTWMRVENAVHAISLVPTAVSAATVIPATSVTPDTKEPLAAPAQSDTSCRFLLPLNVLRASPSANNVLNVQV